MAEAAKGEGQGAVVLLSGGMDSATLLHYVARTLRAHPLRTLSLVYGQRHARELEMAAWQARAVGVAEHRVLDISFFGALTAGGSALTDPSIPVPDLAAIPPAQLGQPPTYVPHRNLAFLSLACAFAESVGVSRVYYGAQAQDAYGYWDCTAPFVERLNALLCLNRGRAVSVEAPFVGKSKRDVLGLGLELGVDFAHTWTCYRGGDRPCGTCPSCAERAAAFAAAGVADPAAPELRES